jgi:hypothetical protein
VLTGESDRAGGLALGVLRFVFVLVGVLFGVARDERFRDDVVLVGLLRDSFRSGFDDALCLRVKPIPDFGNGLLFGRTGQTERLEEGRPVSQSVSDLLLGEVSNLLVEEHPNHRLGPVFDFPLLPRVCEQLRGDRDVLQDPPKVVCRLTDGIRAGNDRLRRAGGVL